MITKKAHSRIPDKIIIKTLTTIRAIFLKSIHLQHLVRLPVFETDVRQEMQNILRRDFLSHGTYSIAQLC